jgi:hypothetical protein
MKSFLLILMMGIASSFSVSAQDANNGNNYGQYLIDQSLRKHPEVATLAMHVTPPKSEVNIIIASNFGRIGKVADADDLGVLNTGKPRAEVGSKGDRYSVELPLRDVSGDTVGVLAVAFPYKKGGQTDKYLPMATTVRNEISRRITNAGNLVETFPYSQIPTNTYAQKLVDDMLAAHPELQIFALHINMPNSDNIILASNIGRIGKKADEDDIAVIETGKPILEVHISGKRFETELQLKDRKGNVIGAVSTVFPYTPGEDKAKFEPMGQKIKAELERKIPSRAKLLESVN